MTKKVAEKILDLNRKTYNKIAPKFSETRIRAWPEMEIFTRFIENGQRVLDIGCGNGRSYKVLKKKVFFMLELITLMPLLTSRERGIICLILSLKKQIFLRFLFRIVNLTRFLRLQF